MRINKIVKKDASNVVIYFDDDQKLIIAVDVFFKSGLRKYDEISEDRFSFLIKENKKYFIKKRALHFLNRRIHSEYELKQKLLKKEYAPKLIAEVLAELKKNDLLNDEKFAEAFISEKLKIKKWGKNKILAEIFKRGINRKLFEKVVLEIDEESYIKSAEEIAKKKFNVLKERTNDNQIIKRKLFSFLTSKGYEYETIKNVANKLLKN